MIDKIKDMTAHARGSLTLKLNAAAATVGGLIQVFPGFSDSFVSNVSSFLGQAQSFASHEATALVGQVLFVMGTLSAAIRSFHNSQVAAVVSPVAPVIPVIPVIPVALVAPDIPLAPVIPAALTEAPLVEIPKGQVNG